MRRRKLAAARSAAILNFHRVSPNPSPYWPPLHPKYFESLLLYLDKHFEVRSFAQLDEPLGKRPIAVLSFDDGYYDFIEYALPLIEKYRMPSNMNVIPHCAETGSPIWNVRLYDFLASAPDEMVSMIRLNGLFQDLGGNDLTSKLKFGMAMSRFLKQRSRIEREKLFEPLETLMKEIDRPKKTKMMTSDDLKQIAGAVELGAHSYSHESMAFESQEFFETDFESCSSYFDHILKAKLRIYAFPNGSYRDEQIDFLRGQGVERILLVNEAFATLGSDVFTRITMYGDSGSELIIRGVGG